MRGQGSIREHARSLVCKYCILFRVYSVAESKGVLPENKAAYLASLEEHFTLNENLKLKWSHFTPKSQQVVSFVWAPQAVRKLVPFVGTSKQLPEDRWDLVSRETVFEETREKLPPYSSSHRRKERFGWEWQSSCERLYRLEDGENRERNHIPVSLSFYLWGLEIPKGAGAVLLTRWTGLGTPFNFILSEKEPTF